MNDDPEDRIGGIGDPATFAMTFPCFILMDGSGNPRTHHIPAGSTGTPQLDAIRRPHGANAVMVFSDEDLFKRFCDKVTVTNAIRIDECSVFIDWLRLQSGRIINDFRIDYVLIDPQNETVSRCSPIDVLATYLENHPM